MGGGRQRDGQTQTEKQRQSKRQRWGRLSGRKMMGRLRNERGTGEDRRWIESQYIIYTHKAVKMFPNIFFKLNEDEIYLKDH